jgi:hypothetical protein
MLTKGSALEGRAFTMGLKFVGLGYAREIEIDLIVTTLSVDEEGTLLPVPDWI